MKSWFKSHFRDLSNRFEESDQTAPETFIVETNTEHLKFFTHKPTFIVSTTLCEMVTCDKGTDIKGIEISLYEQIYDWNSTYYH